MKRQKGLTQDKVIAALEDAHGNMSLAARRLNVSRETVRYYVRKYAAVETARNEAMAAVTDIALGFLVKDVISGDRSQGRYWLTYMRETERAAGRNADALLNLTASDLAGMTDAELDDLCAKLDKIAGRG